MTDSSSKTTEPILTFEGKRYDLNTLPDELKELVRGMQVADAELGMHEDTLRVLAVGRQTLAMQLNERLKEFLQEILKGYVKGKFECNCNGYFKGNFKRYLLSEF